MGVKLTTWERETPPVASVLWTSGSFYLSRSGSPYLSAIEVWHQRMLKVWRSNGTHMEHGFVSTVNNCGLISRAEMFASGCSMSAQDSGRYIELPE